MRGAGIALAFRRAASLSLAAGLAAAGGPQPVEFPHNKHIAKGLECIDCHISVDTGAEAGMPSLRKCMLCHAKFFNSKPEAKKILEYAKQKREIPWSRVYRFDPGALVAFQHAPHVRAKVECKTCHGEVEKMTVAQPAVKHTMGSCLTCHRERHAAEDCAACHY